MKTILNLTQHTATPEQIEAGVTDLPPELQSTLKGLLTFDTLPTAAVVATTAEEIAALAVKQGYSKVMIGGAPFLMAPLHQALCARGIEPLYAFSARVSSEVVNPDGSVTKTQVFKHLGFVSP